MKSTLLNSIWAVTLLAAMSMPIRLAAQEQSGKNALTLPYKAASDTPARELFSLPLSRPLMPALSLRSVGRPSTGKAILRQPGP
jgi:hypothetical protein